MRAALVGIVLCVAVLRPAGASATPSVERASFTSNGHPVAIDVWVPEGPRRQPAVLLVHGHKGPTFYGGWSRALATRLVARGFVVMTPHYFDATASADSPEITAEAFEAWRLALSDAVSFAASRPEVEPRIGLVGVSLGGFLAGVQAAQDDRVAALVAESAGLSTWFPERPRRMPPLLVVHEHGDPIAPLSGALRLAEVARRVGGEPEIAVYDGAEHLLSGDAAARAEERVVKFLERSLR